MDNRNQLINDQEEGLRLMLDGRQVGIWTAIPCIVESVDLSAMTCEVQPAIQAIIVAPDGSQSPVNLPLLVDVPIVFPSAGGFLLTLPIVKGDEVLVVFSSRCIDAWWQNGGVQQAMEARMHDLSDGFAIPGPRSQVKIPAGAISSTDAQLRNDAGTTYISITPSGKIKLVSPSEIDIQAPAVNVTGAMVVSGGLTAASLGTSGGGSATIAGSLTASEVTAGGIPLSTHKHTGVQTGGGTSGPPTP